MITSMALVRAIHLASCMLVLGVVIFRLLVAGPVFTHANKDARFTFAPLTRRLGNLTIWSLTIGVVSWLFWLWLVAARISGANLVSAFHPVVFLTLLGQTQFGAIWEVRLAIMAGFLALAFVSEHWSEFVRLLFAVTLLATLSIAGHAGASIGQARWIYLANDAIHLIAAGIWPAGLAPFAIFLTWALQAKQADKVRVAALITQRVSFVSLIAVGALTITGAANGYLFVGTLRALVATAYGQLLVIKIGVFGAMVMIGALNLLWLKPRIVVAAQSALPEELFSMLRALRRNVLTELSLGTILILVVGVLGVTPPAARLGMYPGVNIPHHNTGAFVA